MALGASQQSGQTPPPQPEIRGVVLEAGTNQPVVDAEIELSVQTPGPVKINGGWKADPSRKSRTDYSGAFSLPLDMPGPYRVEAKKPGYFAPGTSAAPNYREVTLTTDGPVAEVKLYLVQPGVLTGRVVDEETGKPIAKLHLLAVRVSPRGGFEFGGTAAITDGDGQFAATPLPPGEYAVEIRPQMEQEKRVLTQLAAKDAAMTERDYEHTYWPGGHGADTALPVLVPSGATVPIGKLTVRKVPYFRVHVRVPVTNCEAGDTIYITETFPTARGVTQHPLASVPCGKDLFVTGFSPGTYRLILSIAGRTPENLATASVPFSIVDRNIEITTPLTRGVAVDGVFLAEDGTKLPDLTNTKIQLRAIDQYMASMDAAMPTAPKPDGQFRIEGVRLVDQTVNIFGLGSGNYVKGIRYNGAAVVGDLVALQSGAMAHKLTIVIDDKPGAIIGAVMSGDKPVSRPIVIARKWPPQNRQSPSGTAGARGDEAGQFRIGGLIPGEYHVIAVRSIDPTSDAALERALIAAKKVEVGPNGIQSVTLEVTDLR